MLSALSALVRRSYLYFRTPYISGRVRLPPVDESTPASVPCLICISITGYFLHVGAGESVPRLRQLFGYKGTHNMSTSAFETLNDEISRQRSVSRCVSLLIDLLDELPGVM